MSGSAELHQRLRNPYSVTVGGGNYLQTWSDNYMINGAHRECHPDFIATPIGESPHGFLVCQRKIDQQKGLPPEVIRKELITNFQAYPSNLETEGSRLTKFSQSFDMYDSTPNAHPRNTFLGGQPRKFEDRRVPYQATLQGSDYYRDSVKYRGIGVEPINHVPGMFGYKENKYYYSAPPPKYDVTHGVQPYNMWRREQIRMATLDNNEMKDFEKKHSYIQKAATF
jgi:hypothetical protein